LGRAQNVIRDPENGPDLQAPKEGVRRKKKGCLNRTGTEKGDEPVKGMLDE